MSRFALRNNDFWCKIPHGLSEHWCGSRQSFLKIIHKLSEHVNKDGEIDFSARKLANEVDLHVSNVSRFLSKGAAMGLWIYNFNKERNRSFLKFIGGPFENIYKKAQHLAGAARNFYKRVNPWKGQTRSNSNATPTQHLTQHPSDPVKRARSERFIDLIRARSVSSVLANATPAATQN